MFRVGQRICCVDDSETKFALNGSLVNGRIYHVRSVEPTRLNVPGVKLEEYEYSTPPWLIGRTTRQPFTDAPLRASRFRPVVSKQTDISIFTRMLLPTNARETV
jgi:hypothetical protein